MEELLLPSKIELVPGENERIATLVVEPCYHGYGTTIGNAIRRVLLSSLPGAAVTAVKIKNAQHEFSGVEGVKEDVLEIVLNLKQLRMRVFTDEPVRLKLHAKGEKAATAADIEASSDVEIVNKDLHIAQLTDKKSELEMEIFVGKGRGYVPTEERASEKSELGVIAIDAIYTPIREVGFRVDNTRVGQITNYDKLVLTIETDGTITPEAALSQSVKILLDHFNLLTTFSADEIRPTDAVAVVDEEEGEKTKKKKSSKKK